MLLSITLGGHWSTARYSDHLNDLTVLYRWELAANLIDQLPTPLPFEFVQTYLFGVEIDHLLDEIRVPDLKLHKIELNSPITETLKGTAEGLNGIAVFLEKLAFYKYTKKLKEMEIEERELKILESKISLIESVFDRLPDYQRYRAEIEELRMRYVRSALRTSALIEEHDIISVETQRSEKELAELGRASEAATDTMFDEFFADEENEEDSRQSLDPDTQ